MRNFFTSFNFSKKQILLLSITFLGLIGIISYSFWSLETPVIKEKASIVEKTTADGGTIIEVKESNKQDVEIEIPLDTSEAGIQNFIHQMSHQKVIADEKWGMIPLTKERVVRLIDVVESNEDKYKKPSVYLMILNRWNLEDFTTIDKDHNTIWELQGGNIGKATGILSVDEELEFIEKYYH